jgi:hypothetical protein
MRHLLGLVTGALIAATFASCSPDHSSSSSCNDYSPPADFNASTPSISFSKNVVPIFGLSCAFSTCHGATTGNPNGVFLGNDPARVYMSIVNVKGDELPTMPFVTPGDPRSSYLMRKLDASQCALDSQCTGGSCQDPMPKNAPTLDIATRDTIRRWIAQGAKND